MWSKEDWEEKAEESEKLKVFRVEWTRDVREYVRGYIEARNMEEAMQEFERGNIDDIEVEDEEILDVSPPSIEEDED